MILLIIYCVASVCCCSSLLRAVLLKLHAIQKVNLFVVHVIGSCIAYACALSYMLCITYLLWKTGSEWWVTVCVVCVVCVIESVVLFVLLAGGL